MLTLSQSSKHTGKSKSVISRAIDNGKLLAIKNDDGTYSIDPTDLYSLWPKLPPEQPEQNRSTSTGTATSTSAVPPQNTAEQAERAALEALTAAQAGQVDDLRATVADLQTRLDQAENDRRQLEADRRQADENATRQVDQLTHLLAAEKQEKQTLQLEHRAEPESEKGWLGRLFH